MSLLEQVTAELVVAMKAKDAVAVSALRMMKSALANAEIAARGAGKEWDDAAAVAVAQRHAKQLRESIAEYRSGNREDLAAATEAELVIVERCLPSQLSEEEIRMAVRTVRDCTGAAQVGPLMGMVMKELQGKADGTTVRRIVEQVLAGPS
ncbi:GatB/YqeY domain-containing protein [Candidatus Uhrbacteria bacterium]|nr:GatB/YqeY domain-containing protein [Candidatus Uhrbacteria bacterium]